MRVLCIGGDFKENENYTVTDSFRYIPTIYDFDMVILDIPSAGEVIFFEELSAKKNEFIEFFKSGGTCFALSAPRLIYERKTNYDWCPFYVFAENKSGETVICQSDRAKWLLDSIYFSWNTHFSNYPEDVSTILAVNRAGHPISLHVPYGGGHCILLPYTSEKDKLVKLLVQKGLNLIPKKEEGHVEIPDWLKEFSTKEEMDLLKRYQEIEGKLGKYNKFKRLLWETGKRLERVVIDSFREIGIEVRELPEGSHADFEFPLTEEVTGVCEVKGILGSADRDDLRQLLDYYVEQRDIEQRNIKGIFVVNHFRNLNPKERGDVSTEGALDIAKKHNFCIISTLRLYRILDDLWKGKIKKETFLEILQSEQILA